MRTHRIGDTTLLRDDVEIPGLGVLNVNAFIIHADEPVLVDTGRPVARTEFLDALRSVIDPAQLRWIWITHPDRDHMGALMDVLALAPQARLVTNFMGFGYMSVEFAIPMERIYLVNPGQRLNVGGGRALHAFRPPLFDSPMTMGLFDDTTGTCYSSDCFGAPMTSVTEARADDLSGIDPSQVMNAQLLWAGADSPWVATADPTRFASTYDELRTFRPELVLSTHLPPAGGCFPRLLEFLAEAPHIEPFVGPDQAALEAMLAGAPA
jgi:hypothetical protein